jgi:hypothetical protein
VSAGSAMEASEARGTAWPKVLSQALCVVALEPATRQCDNLSLLWNTCWIPGPERTCGPFMELACEQVEYILGEEEFLPLREKSVDCAPLRRP